MAEQVKNRPLQSPLRYPGGKAFLCSYIEEFLRQNALFPDVLVEPFAGGASVSLYLLGKRLVDGIALYDLDPMVASFWTAVFGDGLWLRQKVRNTSVTLEQWEKLHGQPLNGYRNNAWKCLYLNRTSFSGIVANKAGPLGGKSQQSDYKIDCRFYRDTIASRLKALWDQRNNVVEVKMADWLDTVTLYSSNSKYKRQNCLLYLDPPFFHKAEGLYNYYFSDADHEKMIQTLAGIKTPWLLSYDYCPEAISLFRKHGIRYRSVPVKYTSSARQSREMKKELIASNMILPRGGRL